jgi:glycerophosphoryl diester phosphodiesterase
MERARMLYEFGDAWFRMRAFRLLHMVARRGNSRDFPENTLAALRSAIALGARFIEIDVHLSSDGVPMVVHDRQLAHVANFSEMSAAQLGSLDVSQADRFGERFGGSRIASLASTLDVLDGRPEITAFIVIGQTSVVRFGRNQVVSQVVRALKPVRSRCVLASIDLPTIHAARSGFGYPIAWVLPAYDDHTRLKYEALQPEYLFCNRAYVPAKSALWRGPWRWAIYEVNALDLVLDLAARGADFVVTRDVRSLSEAMRKHASATVLARTDASTASITRS